MGTEEETEQGGGVAGTAVEGDPDLPMLMKNQGYKD